MKIRNVADFGRSSLYSENFSGFSGTVQGRDGQILPGIAAIGDIDALAAIGYMKDIYAQNAPRNMFTGQPMIDEAAYKSWLSGNYRSGIAPQALEYYKANGNVMQFFSTTPDQVYAKNKEQYIEKDWNDRYKRALALGLITISFSQVPRVPTTEEMDAEVKRRDEDARRQRMISLGLYKFVYGQTPILTNAEMDKIVEDRATQARIDSINKQTAEAEALAAKRLADLAKLKAEQEAQAAAEAQAVIQAQENAKILAATKAQAEAQAKIQAAAQAQAALQAQTVPISSGLVNTSTKVASLNKTGYNKSTVHPMLYFGLIKKRV